MSAHERVYRRLLRLYPAAFRERYADQMVQLFTDQLRDATANEAPAGSIRLWLRALVDLATTASSEHLRRDRAVAHSAATAPSASARALGSAGVLAGVVLLIVLVVPLDQALNPYRLILFNAFVIALVVGLQLRQAAFSPWFGSLAAALVVLANGWFLAMTVLRLAGANPFGPDFGFIEFLAGMALWLAAAVFGAAAFLMRVFSRWGPILLVLGSLLAMTGIDRLGLVGPDNQTIFGPLSLVGLVLHGCGWILLGAELALRGSASETRRTA